jgi:hypothetical protein
MIRNLLIASVLFTAVALLALTQPNADGCAAVPRNGEPYIRIAEESALIIWNPAKKVQHFIRRAAFDTKSPDFGFLVPTPNMPETPFKEIEDHTFEQAQSWMRPKIVRQNKLNFTPAFMCCFGAFTMKSPMPGDMAPKSNVKVLHEQKVGGFETAVLEADNTEELSNWLTKNGYSNDPELQSWLAPYVADKWKITAFKILQDPQSGQLATTKAVRMSFKTDKPFFPYREPEQKQKKDENHNGSHDPRLLRVLFVSDVRVEGKRGNNAWHANVPWSDALHDDLRNLLVTNAKLNDEDVPAKIWLTSFEDRASPRPGTDEVWFEPAKDQTPIRPEIIRYDDLWIPADVVILGVLVIVFIFAAIIIWKRRGAA